MTDDDRGSINAVVFIFGAIIGALAIPTGSVPAAVFGSALMLVAAIKGSF